MAASGRPSSARRVALAQLHHQPLPVAVHLLVPAVAPLRGGAGAALQLDLGLPQPSHLAIGGSEEQAGVGVVRPLLQQGFEDGGGAPGAAALQHDPGEAPVPRRRVGVQGAGAVEGFPGPFELALVQVPESQAPVQGRVVGAQGGGALGRGHGPGAVPQAGLDPGQAVPPPCPGGIGGEGLLIAQQGEGVEEIGFVGVAQAHPQLRVAGIGRYFRQDLFDQGDHAGVLSQQDLRQPGGGGGRGGSEQDEGGGPGRRQQQNQKAGSFEADVQGAPVIGILFIHN